MDGPDKIRESEQLDAVFFQLYHLGCPPARGLDPLHSSARIDGACVSRYPQSRDCRKAQCKLLIQAKFAGVILQCMLSTCLSANPYIFFPKQHFHTEEAVKARYLIEVLAGRPAFSLQISTQNGSCEMSMCI